MISGRWYGAHIKELDSMFKSSQHDIDTLGGNGNAATNLELYHTTNIDSLRHGLQLMHDSAEQLQAMAVHNTTFDFFTDSMVAISFVFRSDTSKWHFINDKQLEMTELTGEGKGSKIQMDVLTLTDDVLTLKFEMEESFSTVTFGRDKK